MKRYLLMTVYSVFLVASIASPGNAVECPDLSSASTFNEVVAAIAKNPHAGVFEIKGKYWMTADPGEAQLIKSAKNIKLHDYHLIENSALLCVYESDQGPITLMSGAV